jgi:predicted RNA-binding protein with PUA-like domain
VLFRRGHATLLYRGCRPPVSHLREDHLAGSATWDGVTNVLAQKHLRAIKKGDRVFFDHFR